MTGRGIEAVQAELTRQMGTKHDFLVPTSFLAFTPRATLSNMQKNKGFGLTENAHRQVGSFLDIPRSYYDRMLTEAPELLAQNVNRWMGEQKPGTRRMVRVLDNRCRAFLSDRYLPIDNHDVMRYLLPTINEAGCQVVSAELTEDRMYVKALCPRLAGEVKVGDRVQAGVLIRNSEVGKGRVEVSPLVYRLACSNGLVVNELSQRRNHIGRRASDEDLETSSIYSRETIMADIATFLLKARDAVKAPLTEAVFGQTVARMKTAAGEKLENVQEAVEEVTSRYAFSELEGSSLMSNLLQGGDATRWCLVNAVTLLAHKDTTDYARSVELEAIGGELLFT